MRCKPSICSVTRCKKGSGLTLPNGTRHKHPTNKFFLTANALGVEGRSLLHPSPVECCLDPLGGGTFEGPLCDSLPLYFYLKLRNPRTSNFGTLFKRDSTLGGRVYSPGHSHSEPTESSPCDPALLHCKRTYNEQETTWFQCIPLIQTETYR